MPRPPHSKHARRNASTRTYDARPFRSSAPGVPEPVHDMDYEASPPPRSRLKRGDRIDRYVVHRPLGQGGMGEVYGAIDPSLGRRVAIKLVNHHKDDEPFRYTKRLQREALALARLSHPNIVGIYDFGSTPRGAFVAMEFVAGINFKEWMEQHEPSVPEILEVLIQAGRGLAAAHAEGIVHRDFKPSNVMVVPDGTAKVLDFGLAVGTPARDSWMGEEESLLSRRMTRNDVILGTTGYMSPEHLMGRQVNAVSDQFSFCVTLFEAVYGMRPFPGRNPVELARAYADDLRVTPHHPGRIPGRIRRVLARGLSLDPNDRYPSMAALLADLERPRRPYARWAATAAAFVGVACASAATAIWLTRPASPMASHASACTDVGSVGSKH